MPAIKYPNMKLLNQFAYNSTKANKILENKFNKRSARPVHCKLQNTIQRNTVQGNTVQRN